MKKFLLTAAITFVLLTLSGCKDGSSDTQYSSAEVEGNWTCIQEATIHMNIGTTTWNYVTTPADSIYEMKLSYQIVGEKTVQPNNLTVKKIDLIYLGNFRTYTTQSAVDAANLLKACSYENWEVNVTKETTLCEGNTTVGTPMKNISYFDGAVLYNGDYTQVDENFYPEALNTTYTYQKQ